MHRAAQGMSAASAKSFAPQWITPCLLAWQRIAKLFRLGFIKNRLFNNRRMVVWNHKPLVPWLHAVSGAADFYHGPFPDNVGARVPFIFQNAQNG